MKKLSILLGVLLVGAMFSGCFLTQPQAITFTTQPYDYLVPGEDTLDFTTAHSTNAYISKVVCADEETLEAEGPALMSAYAQPTEPEHGSSFNLELGTTFEKFDGQLCDMYVLAWDDSTVEETEAVLRVNIGEAPEGVVEEETEVCVEGEECEEEEEMTEEEETTEEEVVEEEEEVVEEEMAEEETEEVVEEEATE